MKNTKSFIAAAVLTLNFVLSTSFPLQAQPTYQWAFTLGGAGAEFDQGTKITYDASGNIYVIGQFSAASMDADPGTGTATLTNTSVSSNDVFVASYTSAMVFRWAFSIGTSGGETGNDIKVDATNVYITGSLDVGTADFDPSTSTNNLTGWGGFVAKYTLDGAYSWAFLINETSPTAIAVDAPGGNVYITGIFGNTVDFNPGAGTNSITPVGFLGDMFVAKYSSAGAYDWAFNVTSDWDAQDDPETIEVDASNNVYIGGHIGAGAIDFDPGAGATNLVGSGLFIASYTTAMAHRWSFTIAGGGDYALRSIVTDGINVYATGGFDGSSDFDPGPGTTTLTAPGVSIPEDIFVAAYTAATGAYVWAFNPTGLNSDYGRDIALGCSGDVLVTGRFQGTVDFDPSAAVASLSVVGGTNDIFVARYTAASGAYVWARQIGSDGGDDGLGVAANATDVYLTGYFQDAGDFDPTGSVLNPLI